MGKLDFRINKWNPANKANCLEAAYYGKYDDFEGLCSRDGVSQTTVNPICEMTENLKYYFFLFDMPGIAEDKISIQTVGDHIIVTAECKDEMGDDETTTSVACGSYFKSFELPSPVAKEKVQFKYQNGILSLTVPKLEKEKPENLLDYLL